MVGIISGYYAFMAAKDKEIFWKRLMAWTTVVNFFPSGVRYKVDLVRGNANNITVVHVMKVLYPKREAAIPRDVCNRNFCGSGKFGARELGQGMEVYVVDDDIEEVDT